MTSATVDRLVRDIARYGLTRDEIGPVRDDDWNAVIGRIVEQRLGGTAVAAADDGALNLTSAQLDEVYERHDEQLALDLCIERMLVDCDERLARASIETRLLKGPSVARRFYADPALRSFGDGDVLVRGDDMDQTIEILAGAGLHRRFTEPRSSFDRRFVKAVALIADNGLELDLHRALTPGPFGVLIDVDDVLRTPPDVVLVGGREMRCLSPELALVQACAHAVLGDAEPRYVPVRDVTQMLTTGVESARAIALFRRFNCEILAQRAVALVEAVLGVSPTGAFAEFARGYVASRADRWRLGSYRGAGDRYAAQAAATFWVLPTLRERVSFASALAFPGRDYLSSRGDSYPRRVARGTALVVRGRPR